MFCLVWLNYGNIFAYYLCILLLLFVLLVSFAVVHLHIIRIVRSLIRPAEVSRDCEESQAAKRQEQKDGKATQTALVLILAFVVCWLPMAVTGFTWATEHPQGHLEFVSGHHEVKGEKTKSFVNELYFWFQFLAHMNCLLNPFVFTIKDNGIRTQIILIIQNILTVFKCRSSSSSCDIT